MIGLRNQRQTFLGGENDLPVKLVKLHAFWLHRSYFTSIFSNNEVILSITSSSRSLVVATVSGLHGLVAAATA